jgi:probable rRNA maturation factor
MIKINVITKNINWLNYIKNPNNYLERKIKKLNEKDKKFSKNILFFTLLLSGDKEIKYLNKKFRKKNKITDVLSFPFQTKKNLITELKKKKEIYLGDIIININLIKRKKILKYFKKDFDRLWIHGLVHLLGYDHKKYKDYLIMNKLEKNLLKFINV